MTSIIRFLTLGLALLLAIWLRSWLSLVIVAVASLFAWLTREHTAR